MTSWGALLLAGFLYLGLRRPRRRGRVAAPMVVLTISVIAFVAARQSTL